MFKRITLHLARCKEFPEGSARHGYEIVAPLDAGGHLDAAAWKEERARCHVRRFWGDDTEEGFLAHRRGGDGGATWRIDYDLNSTDDDEEGWRLGTHTFNLGDYVSIRDADGDLRTFQVTAGKAA